MISRRDFLARTALASGALAAARIPFLGGSASASPSHAASDQPGQGNGLSVTYPPMSYAPFAYSLKGLIQDGTGLTTDVVNSIQLCTGDDYKFKMSWTPQTPSSTGTLTFRANWIDKFWLVLVFYPNGQVGFTNENNGSFIDLARTYRPVDQTHPARFTLVVSNRGTTFTLKDNAQPGNPVILAYTYTLTPPPLPLCLAVGHNTHAGTKGVWDFVNGAPVA